MKKHWRVQDGVIVNDGQGVYLTTDKDYGDVELLVDFKIGPKGDSGVYLRGDAAGPDLGFHRAALCPHGRRQGLGRPVEQQPRRTRQRPSGPGRQPDRPVEHIPDHPGRRTDHGLLERQARRGPRDPGELLEAQHCRFRPAARSSSRPTTTRSAGGTSPSARSPPTRPTRSWPSTAPRASSRSSTART